MVPGCCRNDCSRGDRGDWFVDPPPPPSAPEVSREGSEPPRPSGPLTGNDLADYYSGALKAHARGSWSGFWCDIFLLGERVVVVNDESHHHWVQSFTVREALAPEVVNDLFVDNGQYPPDAEVTRTRQHYEATLRALPGGPLTPN